MKWRRLGYWLLVPLFVVSLIMFLWRWPQPRAVAYRLYREQGRERTLNQVAAYDRVRSDRFELYYTEPDKDVANLVLETAESIYDDVVEQIGFRPPGRVPLILHHTRSELRDAFGWGNGESALGVYWHGTIRLLSPNAWLDYADKTRQKRAFQKLNPIAHELTHYVLDYLTSGNYPRWFTEGLAQFVEHNVTGFLWIEPASSLDRELYTLADLRDRFDNLENQPLAYRQSYLLVRYMVETYGEDRLAHLIHLLGQGTPFDQAVEQAYKTSMPQIYAGWKTWVAENMERLERER